NKPQHQEQIQKQQDRAAEEAPLLGPHRKRKVSPVLGQEVELILRAMQIAFSEQPPGTDREDRLAGVPAPARGVAVRIEKRKQPPVLVIPEPQKPQAGPPPPAPP